MYPNPWDPLGDALKDFHEGDESVDLIILSDFEIPVTQNVAKFFRAPENFPAIERAALSLCRGTVLDIGAGAGSHVLALQDLGFDVIGLDISPKAVDVMIARGVKNAVCGDCFSITPESINSPDGVDTILMLMNGIGLAGTTYRLRLYLNHAAGLLKPDGILLFDSIDLTATCDKTELKARELDPDRGYFGEVRYRFNYNGNIGPEFIWLYIDPDLLEQVVADTDWTIDAIYPHENGHYLAQLSLVS